MPESCFPDSSGSGASRGKRLQPEVIAGAGKMARLIAVAVFARIDAKGGRPFQQALRV